MALSLTPALCALLLRPHAGIGRETWLGRFFDGFNRSFERRKRRYAGVAAWWIRHAKAAVACLLVICGLTLLCYQHLPSSFVPDEDQGYFLVTMSLPEGTSLNRTMETAEKVGEDLQNIPGIQNIMKVCGYDMLSGGAKSSAATFFVGLDSWEERGTADKKISAIIASANALGKKYPEASISGFTTPSLPGLGMVGGWTMELEDMSGHTESELADIADKIVAAANQRPELSGVRTTYSIRSPKYAFDVDRDQVNKYGVDISDVFTALQINYGGAQVNDFTKFGRNYKVMLQADTGYRSDTEALQYMYVKNQQGDMVPLSELLKPRLKTAASIISRFNGTQSVEISGNAADGYSSGQAMAAMEEIVHETAPSGFEVDWSGQSREEKEASGSTVKIFGLSLLFVFLCLAALYESWSVPYAVLLTVPTGIFGAFFTVWGLRMLESFGGLSVAGLENSVYMQIGVIMVMGLAAKNAILIVEFAKVRTDRGMDPVRAAIEAAKLRLRPILMTSLAFIIGCLPLAVATGAGAAARNNMGTAVVGGMLFATSLGIFLIPVFFVVIETLAAKMGFLKKAAKRSSEEYM